MELDDPFAVFRSLEDFLFLAKAEEAIEARRTNTRTHMMCTEKRRYSKGEAMSVASRKGIRRNKSRHSYRAYQCPICDHWHLATDGGEE